MGTNQWEDNEDEIELSENEVSNIQKKIIKKS